MKNNNKNIQTKNNGDIIKKIMTQRNLYESIFFKKIIKQKQAIDIIINQIYIMWT